MNYAQHAYEHIQYLSETIGGRGSCTADQRRAAEYVRDELGKAGISQVDLETFNGAPSTYLPFTLAFSSALIGTLSALLMGTRTALAFGMLMNLLGAWAMFAESDFASNWTRWLIPAKKTQNVVGAIRPKQPAKHHVVLCAHLDSHRTPIFYSTPAWQKIFGLAVTGAFLSMVISILAFGIGGLMNWSWLRWAGLILGLAQSFMLTLVISAEFTPFSPGANDNASGAGSILSLLERIQQKPLTQTSIHFVFTDCEETGAYGIRAYLDAHAEKLGNDAVYIILDEVGSGQLKTVTEDGLIRKHKTHPQALRLIQEASAGLTRKVVEAKGEAYTDALPITKRGLIAISISSAFPDPSKAISHWHQMSDRIEFIDRQMLQDAHDFTWNILQIVDKQ